jgi:hypothetical protein
MVSETFLVPVYQKGFFFEIFYDRRDIILQSRRNPDRAFSVLSLAL